MLSRLIFAALAMVLISCSKVQVASVERNVAQAPTSVAQQTPVIKYFRFPNEQPIVTFAATISDWQKASAGDRLEFMRRLWSAATRGTSKKKGIAHSACFEGSAERIKQGFFSSNFAVKNVKSNSLVARSSSDGLALSIEFIENFFQGTVSKNSSYRVFQLQHCNAGKSPIVETETGEKSEGGSTSIITGGTPKSIQAVPGEGEEAEPALAAPKALSTLERLKHGWAQTDKIADGNTQGLPTFKIRADYQLAKTTERRPTDSIPDKPSRFDIRTQDGARKFALFMQKYFYEGMISSGGDSNFDFIAKENKKRFWCHMPWMNVGPTGREAIHGMTKERDLFPAPTMKLYNQTLPGSNWGVAYYNSFGCGHIGDLFGSPEKPIDIGLKENRIVNTRFPDQTVSVKILFTTSKTSIFSGAYKWRANVSGVGQNARAIQDISHIQMDILVRAANVEGVNPETGNWIMLTYYFDPDYDLVKDFNTTVNDPKIPGPKFNFSELNSLPAGLKMMRPMGVQTAFEPKDSLILAGSESNSPKDQSPQKLQRLNGPADNPKSSCLSCHGTAGTSFPMSPGIMNNSDFKFNGVHFDFSMQLGLARRNFETFINGL
jgi:hypothetical protein